MCSHFDSYMKLLCWPSRNNQRPQMTGHLRSYFDYCFENLSIWPFTLSLVLVKKKAFQNIKNKNIFYDHPKALFQECESLLRFLEILCNRYKEFLCTCICYWFRQSSLDFRFKRFLKTKPNFYFRFYLITFLNIAFWRYTTSETFWYRRTPLCSPIAVLRYNDSQKEN